MISGRKLAGAILLVACGMLTLPGAASAGEKKEGPKPLDDALFTQMASYKVGGDANTLKAIEALVFASHGDKERREAIERKLLDVLGSPKATTDAKRFVCRQLVNAGTDRSVATLAALVPDAEMSHMALYALARMDSSRAGKALRTALRGLSPSVKGTVPSGSGRGHGPLVGVINALGSRRDRKATRDLIELMKHQDPMVSEAAVAALGKIGGERVANALADAVEAKAIRNRALVVQTYIRLADDFLATADKPNARKIYLSLYTPAYPPHVRTAALRGLLACDPPKAVDLLLAALRGPDRLMQRAAIGFFRDIPGAAATQALAAELPKLSPQAQVLALDALADRRDKAASAAAVAATKSPDETVRVAGLNALATLGDAAAVPLLAKVATSESPAEAAAARASLIRLPGDGIDDAILACIDKGDPKTRVELIKGLSARRSTATVPSLLKFATDPDAGVQREAFNALRNLAGHDALTALVQLLLQAKDNASRGAAEKAVVTICGKVSDPEVRAAAILAALPEAGVPAKLSLLSILGRFGGAKALVAVRAAVKDADAKVQDAAIRSLSSWPDAAPAADLLAIVKTDPALAHKVLAMRGYVRLLALPGDRPATDILKKLQEAMALAPRVDEKKLIISAVADLRHPAALAMLKPYLADKGMLYAEAKVAADKITKALNAPASVTASVNAKNAKNAIDGDEKTRWDTSGAMRGGEWFLYELPVEHEIRGLELEQAKSPNDHPREYEVYISRDGKSWGAPVAKGNGTRPVTKISFKPTYGRFIKIVQTGKSNGSFWSIHTMKIHSKLAVGK